MCHSFSGSYIYPGKCRLHFRRSASPYLHFRPDSSRMGYAGSPLYNSDLFPLRTYGPVPGSNERNGIFDSSDDPVYYWYSRNKNLLDLLHLPFTSFTRCSVYFIPVVMDGDSHHAADLLLFCKEESIQRNKIEFYKTESDHYESDSVFLWK